MKKVENPSTLNKHKQNDPKRFIKATHVTENGEIADKTQATLNQEQIDHESMYDGMIGVGLIANYAFDFRPGLTTIVFSLPLYIFALLHFRNYFYNGLHGLFICSFFIDLFCPISTLPQIPNILISALFGGIFIGTGVSLMLLVKASTGGGDLLALMISKATSLNVGLIILGIDMIVILWGSLMLHETEIVIYSFMMILMIGLTTYTITKTFGNHKTFVM